MKIFDKYIIKNFLIGYLISFCVLIGLRIIIDLFVNLDEFTEHTDLPTLEIMKNIFSFYGIRITLYFRDFAGIITVVAAAFSMGKMVRHNELVAMMASGVSLKRVLGPIIVLAIFLTGLFAIDQEFIIPPLSDKLVRSQDAVPGEETYDVWFIDDENGSLICSRRFDVKTSTLYNPTIFLRQPTERKGVWEVTGWIKADKATYQDGKWVLADGIVISKDYSVANEPVSFYVSDITPKEIPVRSKSRHKALLSLRQLNVLAAQKTRMKDIAQLYSQKHFRITEPIINLVMVLVSLPILVCRDPKLMKSAILMSFMVTISCFVTTFICKMFAAEVIFDKVIPELWAWLPIFIFTPIAVIELDSMKT